MATRRAAMAFPMTLLLTACTKPDPGSVQTQQLAAGAPVTQLFPPADRVTPGPVTGTLLDGTHFDLASMRGQVVVVNFWASW